ncbi:MAG: hypothetical protein D3905_05820 [Candidatus Electrothrix sp. AS4_5]|nr:hypothetical protein [Candidatus Electrothrix gigas]
MRLLFALLFVSVITGGCGAKQPVARYQAVHLPNDTLRGYHSQNEQQDYSAPDSYNDKEDFILIAQVTPSDTASTVASGNRREERRTRTNVNEVVRPKYGVAPFKINISSTMHRRITTDYTETLAATVRGTIDRESERKINLSNLDRYSVRFDDQNRLLEQQLRTIFHQNNLDGVIFGTLEEVDSTQTRQLVLNIYVYKKEENNYETFSDNLDIQGYSDSRLGQKITDVCVKVQDYILSSEASSPARNNTVITESSLPNSHVHQFSSPRQATSTYTAQVTTSRGHTGRQSAQAYEHQNPLRYGMIPFHTEDIHIDTKRKVPTGYTRQLAETISRKLSSNNGNINLLPLADVPPISPEIEQPIVDFDNPNRNNKDELLKKIAKISQRQEVDGVIFGYLQEIPPSGNGELFLTIHVYKKTENDYKTFNASPVQNQGDIKGSLDGEINRLSRQVKDYISTPEGDSSYNDQQDVEDLLPTENRDTGAASISRNKSVTTSITQNQGNINSSRHTHGPSSQIRDVEALLPAENMDNVALARAAKVNNLRQRGTQTQTITQPSMKGSLRDNSSNLKTSPHIAQMQEEVADKIFKKVSPRSPPQAKVPSGGNYNSKSYPLSNLGSTHSFLKNHNNELKNLFNDKRRVTYNEALKTTKIIPTIEELEWLFEKLWRNECFPVFYNKFSQQNDIVLWSSTENLQGARQALVIFLEPCRRDLLCPKFRTVFLPPTEKSGKLLFPSYPAN